MKYKTLIFDLDGTLLDTLSDIVNAVNKSLRDCGYDKQYSYEEGKKLIGSGAYTLTRRALSFKTYSEEEYEVFREKFFDYYREMQERTTQPFNGITSLLVDSKKRGLYVCVATNKPQEMMDKVIPSKFPNFKFDCLKGHIEGHKEKPDPTIVIEIINELKVAKDECLYIGDSHIDVETAKNAGIDMCLVTYGYEAYNEELLKRATYVAHSVYDLRKILF